MQKLHHQIRLQILSCIRMREMHREPEVLEVEAQVGECLDCFARITSKELALTHSVKNGILRSARFTSQKKDAELVKSALRHTARLTNTPARNLKRMVRKVQWLFLKNTRKLCCVFQEMEPPKSSSLLRKGSNIPKPIPMW